LLLVTATGGDEFSVKALTMVAIYSAIGLRDPALDAELGRALTRVYSIRDLRLRREPHEKTPACWFHGEGFCFSVPQENPNPEPEPRNRNLNPGTPGTPEPESRNPRNPENLPA